MKKITFVALLMSIFCLSACAKGKQPIAFNKTPKAVQTAALKNYTTDQILFITKDRELGKDEYEFSLADGTKIEFYENGQLHKVKSREGVMDVFIPQEILKYVLATFPNSVITEYKCERWKQQIEINNDTDLIFSRKGKFLRIED